MYFAVPAPVPTTLLRFEVRVIVAVLMACAPITSLTACGNGETRSLRLRRVVPDVEPNCGAPGDARTLLVTALGDFAPTESSARSRNIAVGEEFAIASFPVATRVLNVEVIGSAGVLRTIGRTTSFDIEELADGDELSVVMAPPRGVCPTSAPIHARAGALAARVSDGVVIVGGVGSDDMPVVGAERYDPRTGTFTLLEQQVYGTAARGLRGATLTSLADGRALLAGGPEPAWQLYDPAAEVAGFQVARFLATGRAHHMAVALNADEVLLIGGCSTPLDAMGRCVPGAELLTTTIINATTEEVRAGPSVTLARIDGHVLREADGRIVVVGGVDGAGMPVADAERVDPSAVQDNELLVGVAGIPSRLAADSWLVAFSSVGVAASAGVAVLPGGATTSTGVANAPAVRSGATLTPLQDGRVLVLGGLDANGPAEMLLYSPFERRFSDLVGTPTAGAAVIHRSGHVAVQLDDGTVLIVGGRDELGGVLADSWIFRPDLTGPFTSDVIASFTEPVLSQLVVPRDPAHASVESGGIGGAVEYVIDSTSSANTLPSQWAIIAGPEFVELSATIRGRVEAGGLAVMFSYRDAANYGVALFRAGQAVTVYSLRDGDLQLVGSCAGQVIGASELRPAQAFVTIVFNAGARLSATVDGRDVLSCDGFGGAGGGGGGGVERGLVGVGVTGEAGQIRLVSVAVRR